MDSKLSMKRIFHDLSLHFQLFIYAFLDNYCSIPHYFYCFAYDLLLYFLWFTASNPMTYYCIPYGVTLHFSVFIVAYPMTFSAFPLIYSCFRFDLLLHSQLINGTLHIVYWCVSIFLFCKFRTSKDWNKANTWTKQQ